MRDVFVEGCREGGEDRGDVGGGGELGGREEVCCWEEGSVETVEAVFVGEVEDVVHGGLIWRENVSSKTRRSKSALVQFRLYFSSSCTA